MEVDDSGFQKDVDAAIGEHEETVRGDDVVAALSAIEEIALDASVPSSSDQQTRDALLNVKKLLLICPYDADEEREYLYQIENELSIVLTMQNLLSYFREGTKKMFIVR